MPSTVVNDVCANNDPHTTDAASATPMTINRRRCRRVGARPMTATGSVPAAHAKPALGSTAANAAAGNAHNPLRTASGQLQAIPATSRFCGQGVSAAVH
jgi:hypothetical protein